MSLNNNQSLEFIIILQTIVGIVDYKDVMITNILDLILKCRTDIESKYGVTTKLRFLVEIQKRGT